MWLNWRTAPCQDGISRRSLPPLLLFLLIDISYQTTPPLSPFPVPIDPIDYHKQRYEEAWNARCALRRCRESTESDIDRAHADLSSLRAGRMVYKEDDSSSQQLARQQKDLDWLKERRDTQRDMEDRFDGEAKFHYLHMNDLAREHTEGGAEAEKAGARTLGTKDQQKDHGPELAQRPMNIPIPAQKVPNVGEIQPVLSETPPPVENPKPPSRPPTPATKQPAGSSKGARSSIPQETDFEHLFPAPSTSADPRPTRILQRSSSEGDSQVPHGQKQESRHPSIAPDDTASQPSKEHDGRKSEGVAEQGRVTGDASRRPGLSAKAKEFVPGNAKPKEAGGPANPASERAAPPGRTQAEASALKPSDSSAKTESPSAAGGRSIVNTQGDGQMLDKPLSAEEQSHVRAMNQAIDKTRRALPIMRQRSHKDQAVEYVSKRGPFTGSSTPRTRFQSGGPSGARQQRRERANRPPQERSGFRHMLANESTGPRRPVLPPVLPLLTADNFPALRSRFQQPLGGERTRTQATPSSHPGQRGLLPDPRQELRPLLPPGSVHLNSPTGLQRAISVHPAAFYEPSINSPGWPNHPPNPRSAPRPLPQPHQLPHDQPANIGGPKWQGRPLAVFEGPGFRDPVRPRVAGQESVSALRGAGKPQSAPQHRAKARPDLTAQQPHTGAAQSLERVATVHGSLQKGKKATGNSVSSGVKQVDEQGPANSDHAAVVRGDASKGSLRSHSELSRAAVGSEHTPVPSIPISPANSTPAEEGKKAVSPTEYLLQPTKTIRPDSSKSEPTRSLSPTRKHWQIRSSPPSLANQRPQLKPIKTGKQEPADDLALASRRSLPGSSVSASPRSPSQADQLAASRRSLPGSSVSASPKSPSQTASPLSSSGAGGASTLKHDNDRAHSPSRPPSVSISEAARRPQPSSRSSDSSVLSMRTQPSTPTPLNSPSAAGTPARSSTSTPRAASPTSNSPVHSPPAPGPSQTKTVDHLWASLNAYKPGMRPEFHLSPPPAPLRTDALAGVKNRKPGPSLEKSASHPRFPSQTPPRTAGMTRSISQPPTRSSTPISTQSGDFTKHTSPSAPVIPSPSSAFSPVPKRDTASGGQAQPAAQRGGGKSAFKSHLDFMRKHDAAKKLNGTVGAPENERQVGLVDGLGKKKKKGGRQRAREAMKKQNEGAG